MQKVNWRRLAVALSAIGIVISSIGAAPNQVSALPKTGRALTVAEMMKTQGRGYQCDGTTTCQPMACQAYNAPGASGQWFLVVVHQHSACAWNWYPSTCNSSTLFCSFNDYYQGGCPGTGTLLSEQNGTPQAACGI